MSPFFKTEFFKNLGFFVLSLIILMSISIWGFFYSGDKTLLFKLIFVLSLMIFSISSFTLSLSLIKEFLDNLRKKDLFSVSYDFFASIKLAIFLMLFLAILSMLGSTYIKQERPFLYYIDNYGYQEGIFIWKTYLNDVFHSWYYRLTVYLLAVNLIVCSIKRLPPLWRQTFGKEKFVKLDEKVEKHLKPITFDLKTTKEALFKLLKKEGFRVFAEEENGKTYIFGEKGRFSRLGVYIVHIGLLVLLSGTLIDSYFGIRGIVQISEGSQQNEILSLNLAKDKVYKLPFYIYEKEFNIKTYGNEAPEFKDAVKSYESYIYIIKDGKVVAKGKTEVNSPFDYDGYKIFQASYGLTGDNGYTKLIVVDRNKALTSKSPKDFVLGEVRLINNNPAYFDGMTISVEKTALNIKNPQAGMNGDFLPALILDVNYNGKNYKVPVIYDPRLTMLAYSQVKDLQNFPYFFAIEEFRPQYYSGFQVSKNPGTPIIWIGSILVVFGMMLAFYTVHRKIWLRIENNKVKVAIYSHKFKEEFKKEFLEKLHLLS